MHAQCILTLAVFHSVVFSFFLLLGVTSAFIATKLLIACSCKCWKNFSYLCSYGKNAGAAATTKKCVDTRAKDFLVCVLSVDTNALPVYCCLKLFPASVIF